MASTQREHNTPQGGEEARAARWARLRAAMFDAQRRRQLMAGMPLAELALFDRRICAGETFYEAFNAKLEAAAMEKVIVTKPPMAEACAEAEAADADNTGLLRIYPSEEVLAAYLLLQRKEEIGKWAILELGAGFCGLAGLLIAKNGNMQREVMLSDGNELCVKLIREHLERNDLVSEKVQTEVFLWDRHAKYEGVSKYDLVIISDCLYLNRIHPDLLNAIFHRMKPDGECVIISPPRYKSLDFFISQAEKTFNVYKGTEELAFLDLIRDETTANMRPVLIRLTHKTSQTFGG